MLSRLAALLVLAAAAAAPAADGPEKEKAPVKGVAHLVYFTLNDNSAAAKDKLIAACAKYLSTRKGVTYFSAGTRAEPLEPGVTDKDYDVALHLAFESKAAHAAYQEHADHKAFIEEGKGNWKKVRVFDFEDQDRFDTGAKDEDRSAWVVHAVFFSLKDASAKGKADFLVALDGLSAAPKGAYRRFSFGARLADFDREVNDKDYDAALFIVFPDKKAHAAYLPADFHARFVEANKGRWKGVRVFDDSVKK